MKHITKNTSLIIILVVCLIGAVLWVRNIILFIGMPQLDYSEGFIMYIGECYASGSWSWGIADQAPYMISFYPPVHYAILGHLINLFGDSLIVGRVLNLVTTAGCCVLVGLIVHRLTGNKLIGLIAGLLPMTHPVILNWSMIVRVDLMAVMWSLAGIYLVLRFHPSRWMYLSIPFLLLAVYTKQSMLAGTVAVGLYLLIRNWRQGLIYCGALGGVGLAGLVAATVATDGEFFNCLFTYQQLEPYFKRFADDFVLVGYTPLVPAIVLTVYYIIKHRLTLPAMFVLVALPVNFVLIYRLGSSHIYFVEIIMAMSITAALALHELQSIRLTAVALPVFAITLMSLYSSYTVPMEIYRGYQDNYQDAVEVIADADYPVLTEHCQLVLDAGQEPYYEPFMFLNLARLGLWDEGKLIRDLDERRIDYVVSDLTLPRTDNLRYSLAIQEAVVNNYQVVYQTEYADMPFNDPKSHYQLVIYKPKEVD